MATPKKDITGQRFGYLTVIECTGRRAVRKNGSVVGYIWKCKCDCGNEIEVEVSRLTGGHKLSCGCKHYDLVSDKIKSEDLTGQRFGRLTVVKWLPLNERDEKHRYYPYLCKCDCGNTTYAKANDLRTGNKISCGCAHDEYSHTGHMTHKTHGASYTKLYKVWVTIKGRCLNPNDKNYHHYGGAGKSICEEWLDFETFREWAYSHGYDENAKKGECTIDRIDNSKGYSPDNCRWVDMKVQRRNQDCVTLYEYDGKKMIATDWAYELGVDPKWLYYKLTHGTTIQEIVDSMN